MKKLPWKVRIRENGSKDIQTWHADTPLGRFIVYQPFAYRHHKDKTAWRVKCPFLSDLNNFRGIGIEPSKLVGSKNQAMQFCQRIWEDKIGLIIKFALG